MGLEEPDMPMPSGRERRGLTLIELMIALAIAGILLGLGVVNIRRAQANQETRSEVDALVSALNLARSRAMALSSSFLSSAGTGTGPGVPPAPYQYRAVNCGQLLSHGSLGASRGSVSIAGFVGAIKTADGGVVDPAVQQAAYVEVYKVFADGTERRRALVVFNANGRPVNGGTVTIGNGYRTWTISLSSAGLVRVAEN